MVNMRNREGKLETDRERMIMVATEFNKRLYGRDTEDKEEENIQDGRKAAGKRSMKKYRDS